MSCSEMTNQRKKLGEQSKTLTNIKSGPLQHAPDTVEHGLTRMSSIKLAETSATQSGVLCWLGALAFIKGTIPRLIDLKYSKWPLRMYKERILDSRDMLK